MGDVAASGVYVVHTVREICNYIGSSGTLRYGVEVIFDPSPLGMGFLQSPSRRCEILPLLREIFRSNVS
jgi:hypothetical protein